MLFWAGCPFSTDNDSLHMYHMSLAYHSDPYRGCWRCTYDSSRYHAFSEVCYINFHLGIKVIFSRKHRALLDFFISLHQGYRSLLELVTRLYLFNSWPISHGRRQESRPCKHVSITLLTTDSFRQGTETAWRIGFCWVYGCGLCWGRGDRKPTASISSTFGQCLSSQNIILLTLLLYPCLISSYWLPFSEWTIFVQNS